MSPPRGSFGRTLLLSLFQILCSQGASRHCPQTASEWFCCVKFVKINLPRCCSRNTRSRVSSIYYNWPSRSPVLLGSVILWNFQPIYIHVHSFLERAPIRAGCIWELFVLRTLFCLTLQFIWSRHYTHSAVVVQRYRLDTFFLTASSFFRYSCESQDAFPPLLP